MVVGSKRVTGAPCLVLPPGTWVDDPVPGIVVGWNRVVKNRPVERGLVKGDHGSWTVVVTDGSSVGGQWS